MTKRALILTLILTGLIASAHAATPKEQYAIDSKQAATRYAEDKKICSDETSSSARMQCARDAKMEYDKALATAKANLKAASAVNGTAGKPTALACLDCGKVTAVNVSEKAGEGGAVGVIAGGVAGALLGHQVGGGTGKDLATIAGAAGGAYAGNKLEQKVNATKVWTVSVQYDNGTKSSFNFDKDPMLAVGDNVKNSGSSIVRR